MGIGVNDLSSRRRLTPPESVATGNGSPTGANRGSPGRDVSPTPHPNPTHSPNHLPGAPEPGWPDNRIIAACRLAMEKLGGPGLTGLGLTSARRGEGRTTLAIASALVQSQEYGHRTLLVELDFERPSLANRLGLRASPGVAELVRGEVTPRDCIQVLSAKLGVVVAGEVGAVLPNLVTNLVSSRAFSQLEGQAEAVVADLPPILASDVGARLATLVAPVALVVRAGSTRLCDVRNVSTRLSGPIPVVLNGTASGVPAWLTSVFGQ